MREHVKTVVVNPDVNGGERIAVSHYKDDDYDEVEFSFECYGNYTTHFIIPTTPEKLVSILAELHRDKFGDHVKYQIDKFLGE